MKFELIVAYEGDGSTYEKLDLQYNGNTIGQLWMPLPIVFSNDRSVNTMYTKERRDAVAGLVLTALSAAAKIELDKKRKENLEAHKVEGTHER